MQFDSLSSLISNLIQKSGLILLNFADDIILFIFTRLGLHWGWLQWLSTALLVLTIIYWSLRLLRYCYRMQHNN